jgi:acylphosphatase
MTAERLEATVRGTVQGVGFRWFVVRHARRLEVAGWVANQDDGTVRIVAEGPAAALDELAAALHEGPAGADVSSVDVHRLTATGGFQRFGIRSRGHAGD